MLGGDFMDRRNAKTEKLLENTLIKLMLEKGFDKISITDLTERADINRGTFYLHYKDKYDLLEQKEAAIIKEYSDAIATIIKKYLNNSIQPSRKENLLPIFTFICTYIKENSDFMKVVLGPNGDLNFQMKVKNFIEGWLVKTIAIKHEARKLPIKYISTIASSGQLGIIQKWLKTGMKESPEEIASIMSDVVVSIYTGMVEDK